MSTQHTPPPWIVADDEVQDVDGNTIADVVKENTWNTTTGRFNEDMPWEANARLIAAAPELLDVLKALMHAHASHKLTAVMEAQMRAVELIDRLTDE